MSHAGRAVFLSYASQDADSAMRIRDALAAAGIEVWFDQSELRGGDAWDASIRARIRDCALFVPVISKNTDARGEGYFRLEWKLAVTRSNLMAEDEAFLLPVTIDDTPEASARVPDAFRERQWSRWREGSGAAAFVEHVKRLLEAKDAPAIRSGSFTAIRPTAAAVPSAAPAEQSVAVLAFSNLSEDKANEYFADGISEELLTVLQKVSRLHVIGRSSSFAFKGGNATAQEIGRKLGVAHLVEGSVRKAGNSVRIAARLVLAATGEQLWSDAYTRDLDDVFAVQSALAQTIVEQISAHLEGGMSRTDRAEVQAQIRSATKGATQNAEAHQLYLQGRFYLNHFSLPTSRKAQEFLERAIAIDPAFALGWAALSLAATQIGGYAVTKPEFDAAWALARRSAQQAVALEPDLATAHLVRANLKIMHDFEWQEAIESVRRAQELAPSDADVAYSAALLAYALGRSEEAVSQARGGVALDPLRLEMRTLLGWALVTVGREEEAKVHFRIVAEINPAAPWGHAGVGLAWLTRGQYGEAVREAQKESTEWARLTVLAMALHGLGEQAQADAALAQLKRGFADVAALQIAQVYAFRGENDHAFDWLERAYRQRDAGLAWTKPDPIFARLSNDPRWFAFLRNLGVADEQLAQQSAQAGTRSIP